MNPKLRVSLNKQVNKVRHDFHFDYSGITLAADSHNDLLEPLIDAIDKHFAPKFLGTTRHEICSHKEMLRLLRIPGRLARPIY
jgi:hypothetical protein